MNRHDTRLCANCGESFPAADMEAGEEGAWVCRGGCAADEPAEELCHHDRTAPCGACRDEAKADDHADRQIDDMKFDDYGDRE